MFRNTDTQNLPGTAVWTSTLTLADAVTRVTCREGGVEQLDDGGLDCKGKNYILFEKMPLGITTA